MNYIFDLDLTILLHAGPILDNGGKGAFLGAHFLKKKDILIASTS